MTNLDLNDLAKRIHEQNKAMGWWDKPREIGTLLMLVISEIAEAMEGERKDLMDEHLPTRKMAEVELADAVIRLLDIAGYYNLTLFEYKYTDSALDDNLNSYGNEKGSKLLAITDSISCMAISFKVDFHRIDQIFTHAISIIYRYAAQYGYDINVAMLEKIEYNKTRADHQPENRAKTNGKKF